MFAGRQEGHPRENEAVVAVQLLSCVQLCDPMVCSIPGSPVLHYLPEFAQNHVHWVGDLNYLILCCLFLTLPSIFPASVSFSMSQLLASGAQNIGVSASAPVLPNQGWFLLGLTGLISLSKNFSRAFSRTTIWKHQFFAAQLPLWSSCHIHMTTGKF